MTDQAIVSVTKGDDGFASIKIDLPSTTLHMSAPLGESEEKIRNLIGDVRAILHQRLGVRDAVLRYSFLSRGIDPNDPPWK